MIWYDSWIGQVASDLLTQRDMKAFSLPNLLSFARQDLTQHVKHRLWENVHVCVRGNAITVSAD